MVKRKLGKRLIAGLLAGLSLVLIAATPAAAGGGYPPCLSACDNQDPSTYVTASGFTCASDALTKGTAATANANIELRYSNRCEVTWGRKNITGTAFNDIIHYSYYDYGYTIRAVQRNPWARSGPWTTMYNDHGLYNRVCIEDFDNEQDYVNGVLHDRECTGLF